MPCNSDDCELNHCAECGCHTVGNTLLAGVCQDCFDLQNDEMEAERRMYGIVTRLREASTPPVVHYHPARFAMRE